MWEEGAGVEAGAGGAPFSFAQLSKEKPTSTPTYFYMKETNQCT